MPLYHHKTTEAKYKKKNHKSTLPTQYNMHWGYLKELFLIPAHSLVHFSLDALNCDTFSIFTTCAHKTKYH
jgi:hypothetical protein